MPSKKPVSSPPNIGGASPKTSTPSKPRCWAFSFRYWKQINFFGLDQVDLKWAVSLLDALKKLCGEEIDSFDADRVRKGAFRYHEINWNQKNIPIQRTDLDWIAKDYLDNPGEYPLFQFQISTGLGRVVGFWDEHDIFNVVLLDPLHNIQPSKDFAYRVDKCSPFPSAYDCLLKAFDELKSHKNCLRPNECSLHVAVAACEPKDYFHTSVILRVEQSVYDDAKSLVDAGQSKSLAEIFELGILAALEAAGKMPLPGPPSV